MGCEARRKGSPGPDGGLRGATAYDGSSWGELADHLRQSQQIGGEVQSLDLG